MTLKQAVAKTNSLVKEIDVAVRERYKTYNKRTEKWQRSRAGDKFSNETSIMEELMDDLGHTYSSYIPRS